MLGAIIFPDTKMSEAEGHPVNAVVVAILTKLIN
jgi:hypothetical protein